MDKEKIEVIKRWVKKAESDLKTIENNLNGKDAPTDSICFHAQQAIEKYIKGAMIYFNEEIIKTHDLVHLLSIISKYIPELNDFEYELDEISHYGVEVRYPDLWADVQIEDAEKAYRISIKIKNIILEKIKI